MLAERVLALEQQAEDTAARLSALEALSFRLRLLAVAPSTVAPLPRTGNLAQNLATGSPPPRMAAGSDQVSVNGRTMTLDAFMAETDAEYRGRDDHIAQLEQRIEDLESRLRSAIAYADACTAIASGKAGAT